MEQPQKIAKVAVELSIGKLLDYSVPLSLIEKVKVGCSVMVTVKGRLRRGVIIELVSSSSFSTLLPIHELISDIPILPSDLLNLALWMSRYYITALDQVIKKMLPSSVREHHGEKQQYTVFLVKSKEETRKACEQLREKHEKQAQVLDVLLLAAKGTFLTELMEKAQVSKSPIDSLVKKKLISLYNTHVDRSPLIDQEYFKSYPKKLNDDQAKALDSISSSLDSEDFVTHLLYGITGSGKTEIYLQAIEKTLKKSKTAIVLVPEISLTAQTIEKFKSRFDDPIAILHHRLNAGQRYDEWHRIQNGIAKIVIGARSALFSPIRDLGLIIVDEEHDPAYKQNDEPPCYQARDVAVMRGKMSNCTVILGSATPSLESYTNAVNGRYILNKLQKRVGEAKLAKIKIIDMKKEIDKAGGFTLFSEPLIEAMKQRFEKGEQTILFLNRRGYHTSFLCKACGFIFSCPHCEKSLTFHLGDAILSCHLCGYQKKPLPRICEKCRCDQMLKYRGVGTEQIEKRVHLLIPGIRTLRIDGDTTKHKGSHEKLFRVFSTGKSDVLIGTQMITKGLHFPSVTLVAILNCDSGLQIPDFRSSESTFQLITQVAGRAGRGELPGEVLLQTQMVENTIIQIAAKQDFEIFYSHEIESRNLFDFPPACRFVKFIFSGKNPQKTTEIGSLFRAKLLKHLNASFTLHPLQPCGHPKIKDFYRFQFFVKAKHMTQISKAIENLKKEFEIPSSVKLLIDVDPYSTFF